MAPSALALHVPITSSITNKTAEIGALKAAAKACRRAHRSKQPQFVPGKFQAPAERGGNSRSHLQGRIFRAERLSAADRKRAGHKFSDDRPERHVAVEYVYGRLGLIHAAAARGQKELLDQKGDDQSGSRRHQ